MIKRGSSLLLLALASIGLATAQNSKGTASGKSGPDPMKSATTPLTPKSAMPVQHKSAAVPPVASNTNRSTNAELAHLERQKPPSEAPKTTASASKTAPLKSGKSKSVSPKIDYSYKKPVGGITAIPPNANSKNSATPRVNKKD